MAPDFGSEVVGAGDGGTGASVSAAIGACAGAGAVAATAAGVVACAICVGCVALVDGPAACAACGLAFAVSQAGRLVPRKAFAVVLVEAIWTPAASRADARFSSGEAGRRGMASSKGGGALGSTKGLIGNVLEREASAVRSQCPLGSRVCVCVSVLVFCLHSITCSTTHHDRLRLSGPRRWLLSESCTRHRLGERRPGKMQGDETARAVGGRKGWNVERRSGRFSLVGSAFVSSIVGRRSLGSRFC